MMPTSPRPMPLAVPTPRTVVRSIYKRLPVSLRRTRLMRNLSGWTSTKLALSHQDLYNGGYYQRDVEPLAAHAAPVISGTILDDFRLGRVVDIGCGTGALLAAFMERGCVCVGLEYADAGIDYCRSRGLDVHKFDIEHDRLDGSLGVFDLAISTEVAEHLPERCAEDFVELLTGLSELVAVTAAPPGQGGLDHVNEQPPEYWIAKFEARGFRLDEAVRDRWKAQWREGGIADFFYQNLMVFRRAH